MVNFELFNEGDSIEILIDEITRQDSSLEVPVKAIVKDTDGTEGKLIVFKSSEASRTDWEEGVCYEISKPVVKEKKNTFQIIVREGVAAKRTERSFGSAVLDNEPHPAEGVSLLHVSDTHLGYEAYGLKERREDFRDAFTQVIDIAIEQDVDAVVHTGDVTHDDSPDEELHPMVGSAIERLGDNGINFYYILGNHDINEKDGTQTWKTILDEFDHVEHLKPKGVRLDSVTLFGMDYQDKSNFPKIKYPFSKPETRNSIVCLHQSGYPIVNEVHADLDLNDFLNRLQFDPNAILLGHSHYTRSKTLKRGVEAICAGSPERTSRGYGEAKTVVNKITVTDGDVITTSHDLDTRPFKRYTVKIDPGTTDIGVDLAIDQLDLKGEVVTAWVLKSRKFRYDIAQAFYDAGAIDVKIHEVDEEELIERLSDLQHGVYKGTPYGISDADRPLENFDFSTTTNQVPLQGPASDSEPVPSTPVSRSGNDDPIVLPPDVPAGEELQHAYTAQSRKNSDDCGFVFRPEVWEETTGTNSSVSNMNIEKWECPHNAIDGEYCIFHTPLHKKQPGEAKEALIKTIKSMTPKEDRLKFIGASFHDLKIDSQSISAAHTAAIDLRHALVSGPVSLKRVRLDQPLDVREARFDDKFSFVRGTRINERFNAVRAVFSGDVRLKDAIFKEKCIMTNAHFCEKAKFIGSQFERGAYFSRSHFEGKVSFMKVRALDNVTFYNTVFDSRFTAHRATFRHDARFTEASFGGNVILTYASVNALANFEKVEVTGDKVKFDGSTFGGHLSMAGATLRGTDASFNGTKFTTAEFDELNLINSDEQGQITSSIKFADTDADRISIADGKLNAKSISFDESLIDVLVLRGIDTDADTFSFEDLEVGVLRMPNAVVTARKMSFEEASIDTLNIQKIECNVKTLSFENVEAGVIRTPDAKFVSEIISFQKARCRDSINAKRVVLAAEDRIDCRRLKVENEARFDSAVIGAKRIQFAKARFPSVVNFTKATFLGLNKTSFEKAEFGISATFDDATLFGILQFRGARFEGTVSFSSAVLREKSELELSHTTVSGQTNLTGIKCEGRVTICEADLEGRVHVDNAEFHAGLTFQSSSFNKVADFSGSKFKDVCLRECVFDSKADFTGTRFLSDPQFQRATIKNVVLKDVRSRLAVRTIDLSGAHIARGKLNQPERGHILYDLENATLGDVSLRSDHADLPDIPILNRYKILDTHFEGFDFVEHEDQLLAVDWDIHKFSGKDYTYDAHQLERTYLNAKTGAGDIGYSRGEGKFFTAHMKYRGKRLKDTGTMRDRLAHWGFKRFSGYGENPMNVLLTAIGLIGIYTLIFFATITAPSIYADRRDLSFILFGDSATTYDGLVGALLISFEAFTTLVFGGTEVESTWIRLIAATEGFFGAFIIALFLFTLTKYIDR